MNVYIVRTVYGYHIQRVFSTLAAAEAWVDAANDGWTDYFVSEWEVDE